MNKELTTQNSSSKSLQETDPILHTLLFAEKARQNQGIELIASENFVSPAIMQAVGSVLTNKYAEGYPRKRYYGGCVFVDEVEELAKVRLSKLFKLEQNGYVSNVQPHSGSQANQAVMLACLNPGDTILSMDLSAGGHLSHGSKVNLSGKFFNIISYGVTNEGIIDYKEIEKLAKKHKPKLIIAGGSAYARTIDFEAFANIAKKTKALLLADIAHIAGLVIAGLHPSPIPHADFITSTTHKTLRGPRGGIIMCKKEWEKKINSAIFPGLQGGPLMHVIAGKAVAFYEAMQPSFKEYQLQIIRNAKAMEEVFHREGIEMVSSGTDNHLLLLNLTNLKITGKEAETKLDDVGITVNKNGIPNDPLPPTVTSGIRVGTPAITTRGFKEREARAIALMIANTLRGKTQGVKEAVEKLCQTFPLYE